MTKTKINDVVKLLANLPEEGLGIGDVGAIIEVYDTPNEAFEVEFVNPDGTERATVVLTRDQFEVIDQGPWD